MSSTGELRSLSQPNLTRQQDPEIVSLIERKRTKSEPLSGLTAVFQIEAALEGAVTQEKIKKAKSLFKNYFPKETICSDGQELGKSFEEWGAMVSDANYRASALKAIQAAERSLSQKNSEFKI